MKRQILFAFFAVFAMANMLSAAEFAYVDGKTEFDQFMYARDNTTRIPYKTSFRMTDLNSLDLSVAR